MADGVPITAGSGTTILTDDTGAGGHAQVVKLAIATDGSAALIPADATDGILVNLGANNDISGTVTANLGATDNAVLDAIDTSTAAAATSLAIVDDWDESDRAKVNPIAGQAGVQGGSGAATALTQRVVLATDIGLPAGTNNIGDVDVLSIAAGDNNIGNVDIVTVPAPLSTTGSGTEAAALRVTLATDSTGVLSVDDNGGTLTVDGTVTANLAAGTNNIGDVDILSIAAGDNNIGNVDVVTLPALAAGTNNIGDVDVLTLPAAAGAAASTMNASSSDGSTALTSTAQAIKASAGVLCGYYIYNPNTSATFVQFYNTAQGSVTVGTTNPLFMLTIPPTAAANLWMQPGCATFSTAMSWAATATAGGNGAPASPLDAVCWYT